MVTIIDYEMGNLQSIGNAFRALGCKVQITQRASDLVDAEAIVLPGVGAFRDGMQKLHESGMIHALNKQVIDKKKPFLGICLGMQFLATESHEHGIKKGLDWIPGTVEKISPVDPVYKIPHIGWNDVAVVGENVLFEELRMNPVFYFVHGYHFKTDPVADEYVTSRCWHGTEITASVNRDNIFGVQFHPEKSQATGLKLLRNFISYAEA